jgi:hypothetical protein
MTRNFEKLIHSPKIIFCQNLSCSEDVLEELTLPFEKPKTLYNKDGNGVNYTIIRANDFIRIITNWNSGILSEEVHLLFDELKIFLSENNDIWIGLA